MFFGDKTESLCLSDDIADIRISLNGYSWECVDDYDNECQIQTRKNTVEIHYGYRDDDGWGSVGDNAITTSDIACLSQGLDNLLQNKISEFIFKETNDLFELKIYRNADSFALSFNIDDGLMGERIFANIDSISMEKLNEYATVFGQWTKTYPILSDSELAEKNIVYF